MHIQPHKTTKKYSFYYYGPSDKAVWILVIRQNDVMYWDIPGEGLKIRYTNGHAIDRWVIWATRINRLKAYNTEKRLDLRRN